jgi:hypothetical protein
VQSPSFQNSLVSVRDAAAKCIVLGGAWTMVGRGRWWNVHLNKKPWAVAEQHGGITPVCSLPAFYFTVGHPIAIAHTPHTTKPRPGGCHELNSMIRERPFGAFVTNMQHACSGRM